MSGHSKWNSIKHKKAAVDAKRGKRFTKLIREITVAAKQGGGDPETNLRLRTAIQTARAGNMPQDTTMRAVKQGAGGADGSPAATLDAAIIFAPVGALVPTALRAVRKGGTVVCAGIHMSDIPSFAYNILWGERVIRSVANLTRKDGEEFLALAPKIPIKTEVTPYPLERANEALDDLRHGRFTGAAVIVVSPASSA